MTNPLAEAGMTVDEAMRIAGAPAGREGAVTLAYVHDKHEVAYSWHHCIVELLGWDLAHEARIMRGGYIAMSCGTDGLPDARNKTVKLFLDKDEADWLFWVDTDMGFHPDAIDRLLEHADPAERPIVGGLAFTQREEQSDLAGGWRCTATPTIFDWTVTNDGEMGFTVRWDYPPDQLTRCSGTGSACVLIHRSVFERIADQYGPCWYDRIPNTTSGKMLSEDLSLCLRAAADPLAIPVHVHTGVKTTHMKHLWLAEDDYYGQRALAQLTPPAPAATEPAAVIVPVLWRPQNAGPFMESLAASGAPLASVYAVADETDTETAQAWVDAGATVLVRPCAARDRPGTFAQKVNWAYRLTDEPWLFLTGDDVAFQPGWLDHAQHAARNGADVVGTNDLHNPRVTSGEHATHLLVRRAYVDEQGGGWDGPKILAHEGYRHWFCDDEVVTAAKQRGAWVFAPHAKVEHRHPLWGLAPDDEVYALGRESAGADQALFAARLRESAAAAKVIIPADIPSSITEEEAGRLARLAAGGDVLELGAEYGFSTVVLAQAARRVTSVDWHQGDKFAGRHDSWAAYQANLSRYGVDGRVDARRGRFEDVLPALRREGRLFDGCFLDGQHDADAVAADLALVLPLVRPGGWVAFHDYGRGPATGHPRFGVTQVADEFGISGVTGYLAWGNTSGGEA